jgi:hypothetical protein
MSGPGAPKTGGRERGTPNKLSADVRAMILAALDRVGGEDYLAEQATANPKAFMSLLGRLIPTQVTGKDDAPLFADLSTEELEQKIAAKLMAAGITEEQARAVLGAL